MAISLVGCQLVTSVCQHLKSLSSMPNSSGGLYGTNTTETLSIVFMSSIGLAEAVIAARWKHLCAVVELKETPELLELARWQVSAMEGLEALGWPRDEETFIKGMIRAEVFPSKSIHMRNKHLAFMKTMMAEEKIVKLQTKNKPTNYE